MTDEENCLFCGIVRGDVPSDKVVETDLVLAFRDIDPQAPTHILVIPKVHVPTLPELAESHPDDALAVLTTGPAGGGRRRRRRRLPAGLQQRRPGAADGLPRPRARARRPRLHLAPGLTLGAICGKSGRRRRAAAPSAIAARVGRIRYSGESAASP